MTAIPVTNSTDQGTTDIRVTLSPTVMIVAAWSYPARHRSAARTVTGAGC